GKSKNIFTGVSLPYSSRYPNSNWYSLAAYLVFQHNLSDEYYLQTGIRYNYFGLKSEFDTTYYPLPFTNSELNSDAITGSIGLTYNPNDKWSLSFNLSTGFRAPNVDDIGKVFDSEPGAVVVPNPNLNAEYANNVELSIAKIFSNNIKVDLTGYYTILNNAMVRKDFTINGLDSILYDGTLSKVQAIQNSANAYVWGVQAGLELNILKQLSFSTKFNYQKGEEELDNGSRSPLRHAAPLFSNSHFIYRIHNLKIDASFIYNGEISNSNLAEEEQGKINIYAIDEFGNPYSPSWYNLNLKLQYLVTNNISATFGIENLTDQRYRPYSSGISGPGRNFIFSLKLKY
ncbi:MAG: TonB-dependent receptor, partial [Melioribacteraceae bacterium]|nr:TonB-dependent receptor [Melioribacteraceae bacterium]